MEQKMSEVNDKKQIEEMAKILIDYKNKNHIMASTAILADYAEELYNADCQRVIRCKDCKHFYQDGNIKLCRHWNCHSTEDDAYCSYAKMKGGAE